MNLEYEKELYENIYSRKKNKRKNNNVRKIWKKGKNEKEMHEQS